MPEEPRSRRGCTKGCLVPVLVLFALFLVWGATSGGNDSRSTTTSRVASTAATKASTTTTHKVTTTTTTMPTTTTSTEENPLKTAEAVAYASAVAELMETGATAMQMIGETAPLYPAWNEEQQLEFAVGLGALRTMEGAALKLDPPEVYRDVHHYVLSACGYFGDASYLVANGVDEGDVDKIREGTDRLLDGNAQITLAKEAMDALLAQN